MFASDSLFHRPLALHYVPIVSRLYLRPSEAAPVSSALAPYAFRLVVERSEFITLGFAADCPVWSSQQLKGLGDDFHLHDDLDMNGILGSS